ncbi:MAG: type II secretion system protein [Candidatus Saccharibacteria bacterium]|nr:type II secretion system protein [Candidatus Saccharibacteria bacterium]
MANKKLNKKEGFTIIEVVLVLAIAGLIFLMVFVALPALQRSQRDTQRRDDMARLATAITSYQSNNNNKLPISSTVEWSKLIEKYITSTGDTFVDPSGEPYKVANIVTIGLGTINPYSTEFKPGDIYIYISARCAEDGKLTYNQGSRSYAIYYNLEGGGAYCKDNT